MVSITITKITADDGWVADCNGSISSTLCTGEHQLYTQNQQILINQQTLIQEQNQTNHLLTRSICMSDKFPYDNVDDSIWSNKTKFFSKCFPELWNDTK